MIRFITDKDFKAANKILKDFNFELKHYNSNPFFKCLISKEDMINGVLVFDYIYDRIELNYLVVEKKFRKRGIAQSLLGELFEFSKRNNIKNITLEVNKNNIPAINLYKKNGFKYIAIRKNYYGLDDALLMIRKFDNNE